MKNFMKKWILGFALLQMILPATGVASTQPKEKSIEEYMAIATVNTVNRLETVGKFLKWIELQSPNKEEVKRVEKYLLTLGLTKNHKFPKLQAEGANVMADKEVLMTYAANHITVNGRVYRPGKASFEQVVKQVVASANSKKTAWYSILLLPEANALSFGAKSGLIGMLAGGALGALLGPSMGFDRTEAALGGAALGTLGGLAFAYMRDETASYYGNGGQVTCNQQNYQINNGQGHYFNQPGQNQQVPGVIVGRYYGPRPCNVQNAQYMNQDLQYWNTQRQLVDGPQDHHFQNQQQPGNVVI